MKAKKLTFTTRYVLVVGILLFVANTVLGLVILNQSKVAMRSMIDKDMLDVVNAAAGSLDGDALGSLTERDVDGPVFREIERRLLPFQRNVDIKFIYAVKQVDEDTFVFTVDPDPVDPGAFGEEVLTTPALINAATGTPSVDQYAAQDRWGNFYSAYSPVFDSEGEVAGIIGIDFDADWYESQIRQHTISIAVVTSLSVVLGAVVTVLITNRVRRRFKELNDGLSQLSEEMDILMEEMATHAGFELGEAQALTHGADDTVDELGILERKIHTMQDEMGMYLDYMHTRAYTDSLTRVGNSTAYHEICGRLDGEIDAGTADFWLTVFDINSLKELNDTLGHEYGDAYIQAASCALTQGFDTSQVFRIGGDEFAVIVENVSQDELERRLQDVRDAIALYNAEPNRPRALAISWGSARFDASRDAQIKDVFARADQTMYENKRTYYRDLGIARPDHTQPICR